MKITNIQGAAELANGVKMPYLGLGVWQTPNGETVVNAVTSALNNGYRHIDTASIYRNEEGVGQAVQKNSAAREDIFITTKVWNSNQGYDSTIKAFEESLKKLQMNYLDLYLVHWPVKGKYKETWRALETLYNEGRVRAIGVSNFLRNHLDDLLQSAKIIPMVNQVEFHPALVQQPLLDFCKTQNIQYEAWSPLMQGQIFEIPLLRRLAEKYNKTVSQLVLRWDLQKGVITIPKSIHANRIHENAQLFNFEISDEDMKQISLLDKNLRVGPDPDNFNF